ncbi:MAG: RNA-binding protein [Lentisphaeraceae bacterium]|nr:RNA-binding protein [Lentisphaeraceae bacterium]
MKILVRNLNRVTTESDLKKLFEAYGKLQYCKLIMDPETKESKGFAFVEMPKVGEAKAAIKNLNDTRIDDYLVRVKKAPINKSPKADTKNDKAE